MGGVETRDHGMSVHRISLASVMKLTAIVALDLALIHGGFEFLMTPVLLFLLATFNIALVQAVILGQPFQVSHSLFLAIGTVSSVAITALLADEGPNRRVVWVAIAMGLSLLWVASLLMSQRMQPGDHRSVRQQRSTTALFEVISLLAATALGLVLTGTVFRSLVFDLGYLGQVVWGFPELRGRTSLELRVQEPSVTWALGDAMSDHTLRARRIDELVVNPSSSWSLGGIGHNISLPKEITPWWAVFDSRGPGLALRIAVDLIAMWPLLLIVGVALLALRMHRPDPSLREMFWHPGFWACAVPILTLLALPLLGICFAVRFSPLLPSGAVCVTWMALVLSRRWHPELSWIDRMGRALGFAWVVIFLLSAWAMRCGLIIL